MTKILNLLVGATLFAALLSTSPSLHAAEGWSEDFEAAKKQAMKEKKDLLMDFTGSDWCGWCIKLKNEVFTKAEFKKEAPKHFVLVELDFPKGKQQSPKIKAQNRSLQQKYGIRGYPTIYLTDSQGRPYAKTGYQPGGPAGYLQHLAGLRAKREQRDSFFAKAKKAKGVEKAKLLEQGLEVLNGVDIFASYSGVIDQIIQLDADNKAGLKSKYEGRKILTRVQGLLESGKTDEAIKQVDKVVKSKVSTDVKQQVMQLKAFAVFRKNDIPGAIKILKEAQKLDSESQMARRIGTIIGQLEALQQKGNGGK